MALKYNDSVTVKYHKIFDYRLTKEELFKWQYKKEKISTQGIKSIKSKVRLQREKYSKSKLAIAKKAASLISKIPSVKFVGVTGSLAMMNAGHDSDIDLIIITATGKLWISRLLILLILLILRIPFRRSGVRDEKNKLCLNMWLDESDLVWGKKDRNIYTAHEIAQIIPLLNKNKIYEKFLYLNKWILEYWPNAVPIERVEKSEQRLVEKLFSLRYALYAIELVARQIQYLYMSKKITREVVTPTRAIFHPNDWGSIVMKNLK